MTDFELMKAIMEKAECDEGIYFAPDESEIVVNSGATFYFHPGGDLDIVVPHNSRMDTAND